MVGSRLKTQLSASQLLGPALLAALGAALLFTPLRWPCPMATVMGIPCPTCGMTRAARFALHGELAAATRMHPLWFVILPALAALVIGEAIGFIRFRTWGATANVRWVKPLATGILVLLVVVWIARFGGAFGGPVPVR